MGDVIELPNGSTPIDFAYRVHSNVGDKAVGAIVNSNMVPLDYQLKNEDIVKIITNNNSLGPSREWLNIVKTTGAKNKIRAFFNKANKEENIKKGEEILIKELRKNKINNEEFMQEDRLNKLLNELKIGSLTELYSSIGSGKLSIKTVFDNYLKKEAGCFLKPLYDYLIKAVLTSKIKNDKEQLLKMCKQYLEEEYNESR